MKTRFGGTSDRPFPMSLREILLIHMMNLSNEIVRDGLKKEYEPALDRLMNWFWWEFKVHHGADVIPGMGGKTFGVGFDEVMDRDFGKGNITDTDRVKRIQDKERILSALLAVHKIHLGTDVAFGQEEIPQEEYDSMVNKDGFDGQDSTEDS